MTAKISANERSCQELCRWIERRAGSATMATKASAALPRGGMNTQIKEKFEGRLVCPRKKLGFP